MPIYIKKKEGESVGSVVFRFSKKVQQSGTLLEAKKRRFAKREQNKRARRESAIYRAKKRAAIDRAHKLGVKYTG